MLYDTNRRLMEGALHPEVSKLKEKGLKSVRSRVGVLKDFLPFGVEELRRQLPLLLCNRTIVLTDDDVQQIEHLEQRYYDSEFLLGSTERNDAIRRGRIEGCGLVELHFRLHGSLVKEVELTGDFFVLDDVQQAFNSCFSGQPFTHESLVQAIRNHHPEQSIRGLTEEGLIKILDN
jgi:lipoic acid synthetase/lipoate-protein ligase A